MTRALRHRGPDDEGYIAVQTQGEPARVVQLGGPESTTKGGLLLQRFSDQANLYLGHRRLAILDLSTAGHQPMRYGEHLSIVYNGELYNYLELRQELRAEGYEFTTQTDTEVILAAYHRWGEDSVRRFNGDWAFCILDTRSRILFISRDRYGVKPLYYFRSDEYFAFASEIKALLCLPFVPRALNRQRAFDYCAFHCRDHTEETLFDSIYQLAPGQNMKVDMRTGETRIQEYYTLSYCPDLGDYDHRKAVAYAANIRDLLFEAVRLRLRADVPVGTCLSGGLDSSAIVTIMAKISGTQVGAKEQNTFTASFPGEPIDESRFARLVATSSGSRSHFIYPSKEGCWCEFPAILYHQDEPHGGPSIYSHWEVMREASKHVKVVLDGQGADEVFGGYWDNRASFLAQLLGKGKIHFLAREIWYAVRHAGCLSKAIAAVKPVPVFFLGNSSKRIIYRRHYNKEIKRAQEVFHIHDWGLGLEHIDRKFSGNLNELLFHYLSAYSLPYLLRGEDRNSMAHSIEARVPFTDYRLVDYVFSLPCAYKIRHGWTKWLLRLAVQDLLPSEIVWRKDKIGFAIPPWASRRDEWNMWTQQNFHAYKTGSLYQC